MNTEINSNTLAVNNKKTSNDFIRRLVREKPMGLFGAVIVVIMILLAIFANVITHFDPNETTTTILLQPSSTHFFGTDNLGRDLFTRILYGARISLIVGIAGTLLSMLISLLIGVTSGFFGGAFDLIVQRFIDAWLCFPGLLILIALVSIIGNGMWQVIVVLAVQRGISGSRVIRAAILNIKGNVYVTAAKAMGATDTRIMIRHLFPNIIGITITLFTTRFPNMILSEASLSFLGLGIPAPNPSWGGMLSGSGRQFMLLSPWLAIWPGLFLTLLVFGANMFGDAVRDLLDPRLRGGSGRYGFISKKIKVKNKVNTITSIGGETQE